MNLYNFISLLLIIQISILFNFISLLFTLNFYFIADAEEENRCFHSKRW